MASQLDGNQTLQGAYNDDTESFNVTQIAQLVPETYDSIAITYVVAGNGAGEIETVSYYQNGLAGTLVATLTLAYDVSNNLVSVVRS